MGEVSSETLVELALRVLREGDPVEKARLTYDAATSWLLGRVDLPFPPPRTSQHQLAPPERPARLPTVRLVAPQQMPKLGKGGSAQSRLALLHSLVHTESWAIDLSWDIIARFGTPQYDMPRDFFTDFVRVAQDEARHFTLLSARLQELGSFYGAFPAHDGLWDSASRTSSCLLARLAVEHCVHEARGLDVLPTTISRFRSGGDEKTAELLETVIYPEEITHCAAGIRWFRYLILKSADPCSTVHLIRQSIDCQRLDVEIPSNGGEDSRTVVKRLEDGSKDDENDAVIQTFHDVVRRYFRGPLKPPFNAEARKAAGFGPAWYEPLAVKFNDQASDVAM